MRCSRPDTSPSMRPVTSSSATSRLVAHSLYGSHNSPYGPSWHTPRTAPPTLPGTALTPSGEVLGDVRSARSPMRGAAGVADQGRGHAGECSDSPRQCDRSADTPNETRFVLFAGPGDSDPGVFAEG